MIGIDPHPFAAIPERPKHHTRLHRIVARIRVEENKLVGHLGGVTRDLERRARILCELSIEETALATLIHQRRLTPSCGGCAATAK
jgi:hypothetical protein